MLFIFLIILAVFIGLCVIMEVKNTYDIKGFDLFFAVLICPLVSIAIICTIMVITTSITLSIMSPEVEYTEIESLSSSRSTNGSFVFGCGSINKNPVYVFYQKINDNQYIQKTIEANGIIIEENDGIKPRIEFEVKRTPSWYHTWIYPVIDETKKPVKIIVPTNTIVRELK